MITSNRGKAERWMSVLFAFLTALPAARAADAEWKVGLAQVKITPERPLFLAGYASRNKPFTKVEADLYAKALVLEDSEGHLQAGIHHLTGKVASTGDWDTYRRTKVGEIVLGAGRQQVTFRSAGKIYHPLLDLKSIKLVPLKE